MAFPIVGAVVTGAGRLLSGGVSKGAQGANFANTFNNATPQLHESCRCTIYGNPNCSLYQMYWLCCSIVFGMIRRRDTIRATPPNGMIMVQYDPTLNYMTFEARQVTGYVSFALTSAEAGNNITLFSGPLKGKRVEGGKWEWNSLLPRTPGGIVGGKDLSKLGWENRVIFNDTGYYSDISTPLTPSYGPVPPGDETSRGVNPVAQEVAETNGDPENWYKHPEYLIYAALEYPCSTDGKVVQKVDPREVSIPASALTTPTRFPTQSPQLSPGEQFITQQQ